MGEGRRTPRSVPERQSLGLDMGWSLLLLSALAGQFWQGKWNKDEVEGTWDRAEGAAGPSAGLVLSTDAAQPLGVNSQTPGF